MTITALMHLRPLVSLGVVALLAIVFKPLLSGLARAALLVIKPRRSLEEREATKRLRTRRTLDALAREVEASQPNFAAELRNFSPR